MAQRIGIALTACGIILTLWAFAWFAATAQAGGTENLIQEYGGKEMMEFALVKADIITSVPKLAGVLCGGLILCLLGLILQKERI